MPVLASVRVIVVHPSRPSKNAEPSGPVIGRVAKGVTAGKLPEGAPMEPVATKLPSSTIAKMSVTPPLISSVRTSSSKASTSPAFAVNVKRS